MNTSTMMDVTGRNLNGLVTALHGNWPQTIGSYVTGTDGVAATAAQLDSLVGKTGVFRYDQTPSLASFAAGQADGADIEPGAGTFAAAVEATHTREGTHGWPSWWYVNGASTDDTDSLTEARAQVQATGFKKVRFIVAMWQMNLAEATAFLEANEDVDAVQWASPASNPNTPVPGTNNTLSELGVDLNVIRSGLFAVSKPAPPATTTHGVVVADGLTTYAVTSADKKTWTV